MYKDFIQSIRESRENVWFEHSECHHIIPRSLGGTDDWDNLIYLTYREHFIAHKLLAGENPDNYKLCNAYWRMCNGKEECTPEEYEIGRRLWSNRLKVELVGEGNPNYNTRVMNNEEDQVHVHESDISYYESMGYTLGSLPKTEEARKHLSESLTGHDVSEETKANLSDAQLRYLENNPHQRLGKKNSEESNLRISQSLTGKFAGEKNPMYGRRGEDNPNYGIKRSEETRRLQSIAAKGNKSNTGRICVNDGTHNRFIFPDQLEEFESNGYVRGRV